MVAFCSILFLLRSSRRVISPVSANNKLAYFPCFYHKWKLLFTSTDFSVRLEILCELKSRISCFLQPIWVEMQKILFRNFAWYKSCIDKPKVVSRSQSKKLTTWFSLKSQCPKRPKKGKKGPKFGQSKRKKIELYFQNQSWLTT